MSKWRPSKLENLYVIPDIHGELSLLNKILKRILPLRNLKKTNDKIIFLGDYVDRHKNSHLVIDRLIELKKEYGDSIVLLVGNHELMMAEASGMMPFCRPDIVDLWMKNGGFQTMAGYIERAGIKETPNSLSVDRFGDLIPLDHKKFLDEHLCPYYIHDNYIFVHGGFDPSKDIKDINMETLVWDRSLRDYVLKCIDTGKELFWEKCIVAGHNSNGRGVPIVTDKFMMLDCGSPKRLLVTELNSMEAFMADPDNGRLVKYTLEETVKVPGIIRRR